ncbi:MAG: 30S ribosomal protein S16 [Candidatus Pacebacteria bacterium]|nr:30S ribosomal protein S16 [Candidatus Paceibacterota bacterium]
MIVIRLKKEGKKHQPIMRVVLVEKTQSVKSNKFIEILGWVNPIQHESDLKKDRILY